MAAINKTRERRASVTTFLAAVKNAGRREDAQVLTEAYRYMKKKHR